MYNISGTYPPRIASKIALVNPSRWRLLMNIVTITVIKRGTSPRLNSHVSVGEVNQHDASAALPTASRTRPPPPPPPAPPSAAPASIDEINAHPAGAARVRCDQYARRRALDR
ncbi:hypothetical protein EVAR_37817_1 [Eumeta japonica]|uniref:Uncharacterized protein n=1 Tax=Eumeta variegata TaxID=151549 RepID=A0A4C1W7B5_EUMVA|nr:hypothetical protein EVAR_37817_1 [Eumeta japonica]